MANRLTLRGFDLLRRELHTLGDTVTKAAAGIVGRTTQAAENEIRAAYPVVQGDLKNGVRSELREFRGRVQGVVRNTAPQAESFEIGTEARHTALGANRGRMPPGHVFVPIVIRRRARMLDELVTLVEAHGLKVSGSV